MLEAKCHQLGTPPLVAGGGLHGIGVAHHFARTVQNQKSAISLTPTWTIVARVVASHDVVSRGGSPSTATAHTLACSHHQRRSIRHCPSAIRFIGGSEAEAGGCEVMLVSAPNTRT